VQKIDSGFVQYFPVLLRVRPTFSPPKNESQKISARNFQKKTTCAELLLPLTPVPGEQKGPKSPSTMGYHFQG